MTPATLSGIAPRREDLVKATWNHDKGLFTPAQLDAVVLDATRELVDLQRHLGFSPLTDGLLAWQDQFRPLIESTDGLTVGGVTRLFETNRFYRQPVLTREPVFDPQRFCARFPHVRLFGDDPWTAILPSPYWLTRATLDHHSRDEAARGDVLAAIIGEAARALSRLGASTIQFQEPALFHEPKPDVGFANELFAIATEGLDATTIANFPNGNAAPHHSFLQTVPVDVIGIDFVETLPEKVSPRLVGRPLLAQVVNSQESLVETPEEVAALLSRVTSRLAPERLAATHTWDLEFVPSTVATRKLETLAAAARRREVVA